MKRHPLSRGLVWLMLLPFCSVAAAQEITLPLSDGSHALADFRPGDASKPAIFILHGFLQTSRFSTVQLIADELADNGYTVLAPTLTLNIDQRRNSLTCDAIQNHTIADSDREIGKWLAWLREQGYPHIITIGHSSGSMRLLSYLSTAPQSTADLFIATSIGPIRDWRHPQEVAGQLELAAQRAQSSPQQISGYTLGFCRNNYTAPADAFLSYMQWSDSWVLEKLQQLKIPVHVVLGTSDTWLPPGWPKMVAATALPLSFVKDASHNFTGPQEFEFQELLLNLVEEAEARQ